MLLAKYQDERLSSRFKDALKVRVQSFPLSVPKTCLLWASLEDRPKMVSTPTAGVVAAI